MSVNRYRSLLKEPIDNLTIVANVPVLTDKDYKRTYITRYFLRKSNDVNGFIYEVNKETYRNNISDPYYVVVSLKWKVKGESSEVKKQNEASVKYASNTISRIGWYLPNLLQFHQP
jgi:hypothetical protein